MPRLRLDRTEPRWGRRNLAMTALVILALWLLWRDPYSRGLGVSESPFYQGRLSFQTAVALVEAGLLIMFLVLALLRVRRPASSVLLVEVAIFLSANATYLIRDGTLRLFFGGYSHPPTGLLAVAGGSIVRWLLHRQLVTSTIPPVDKPKKG